jgi:hypothetical protein
MRVSFLLPDERDLASLGRLDPDRDHEQLKRGERAWVLQTYLRLAAAGWPVELTGEPPADGLVVFHSKHRKWLVAHAKALRHAILVGIRGDLHSPLVADFEVLQNACLADGRKLFHVPHWPQPGLVPRDPARGDAIRRIAYKGFARNLATEFGARRWLGYLAARGLEWEYAAAEFAGPATDDLRLGWHDFRSVDLVLAVRPPSRRLHPGKPATKLINGWLAGVPALLGPEIAYRQLRRSPSDYVEVRSVDQAIESIERLLADRRLYGAMREQCTARAAALTPQSWIDAWTALLFTTLPALAEEVRESPLHRLPLAMRAPLRGTGRWLRWRPVR